MRASLSALVFCMVLALVAGCASGAVQVPISQAPVEPLAADTGSVNSDPAAVPQSVPEGDTRLSAAARLVVRACENYLEVNTEGAKVPEVLSIKGAAYYNSGLYQESRSIYTAIIDSFPGTNWSIEATRLVAQSYYEEQEFELAQQWYRTLKDVAVEGTDQSEALARIAESVFRQGEYLQSRERYGEAAAQFERVALEFPQAPIAAVALFNAGAAYELQAEWSRAILMYQRLLQRSEDADLLARAVFRTAKCYEKLSQWEPAANSYLRVVATWPRAPEAQSALYNAGICFENAGQYREAGATFERLAAMYPHAEDAPDVLFKAGELFGRTQDWEGVTRVNTEFSRRFGNDRDRVVQAQCMIGIALYMQERQAEALRQLRRALETYATLREPSTVNRYYAAKAQFTIAEITHAAMTALNLPLARGEYQRVLRNKSELLDRVVEGYTKVVSFGIMEWTTRGIYRLARAHEDFAAGVMAQPRPGNLSIEDRLALELGIARAVDEYTVGRALPYHEQNVRLGIREKIEDTWILESRARLLALPFEAASNYLELVTIARDAQSDAPATGFALIARTLSTLQRIAPFQERSIELLYTCLEKGATYAQQDSFYTKASTLITALATGVGETYAEVVQIARSAPVPETFDRYERFVYKTRLLGQIQGYEDQAIDNCVRTIDIAAAYSLDDAHVDRSRALLARVLFMRGRSYDLLGDEALGDPPFPDGASAIEQEEYLARFEEIGIRFKEQAIETFRAVFDYAQKRYAGGDYVTHAYVRLYQQDPHQWGVARESLRPRTLASGPAWRCSPDTSSGWRGVDFDDAHWETVQKGSTPPGVSFEGFPDGPPPPMWHATVRDSAARLYLRRVFDNTENPHQAELFFAATGTVDVFFNEAALKREEVEDGSGVGSAVVHHWDLMGKVRQGRNVIAVAVRYDGGAGAGVYPFLRLMTTYTEYLPHPPGLEHPLTPDAVTVAAYRFPHVPNFSPVIGNTSVRGGTQ